MSEPWATVLAHANYVSGKVPKEGKVYENLIKACIKIQCKNELNKQKGGLQRKPPSHQTAIPNTLRIRLRTDCYSVWHRFKP